MTGFDEFLYTSSLAFLFIVFSNVLLVCGVVALYINLVINMLLLLLKIKMAIHPFKIGTNEKNTDNHPMVLSDTDNVCAKRPTTVVYHKGELTIYREYVPGVYSRSRPVINETAREFVLRLTSKVKLHDTICDNDGEKFGKKFTEEQKVEILKSWLDNEAVLAHVKANPNYNAAVTCAGHNLTYSEHVSLLLHACDTSDAYKVEPSKSTLQTETSPIHDIGDPRY